MMFAVNDVPTVPLKVAAVTVGADALMTMLPLVGAATIGAVAVALIV